MKFRSNYPFIYFFIEPNVVFVYKIETDHYLTLRTIDHYGEWKTFELEMDENFNSFQHKEYKELEGRSYFLSQKDRNRMLHLINQQIQRHRRLVRKKEVEPVHIVCSEAAAGRLRFSLDRPKIVIGVGGMFSIGPIWRLEHKEGKAYRNEWLNDHINFELDDYVFENNFANALREVEDIIESAPIHIWYANNADEQIGLRFILYLLKNKSNDIFLFNTTELYMSYFQKDHEEHPIKYTNQMEPDQINRMYKEYRNKPLTEEKRGQLEKEWIVLSRSKEVLHILKGNEIIHVSEQYYDSYIIETIKQLQRNQEEIDFILTGTLIGTLIQKDSSIYDVFLEYRIRELVYRGVLEMKGVPKSMRHYRVKLKS